MAGRSSAGVHARGLPDGAPDVPLCELVASELNAVPNRNPMPSSPVASSIRPTTPGPRRRPRRRRRCSATWWRSVLQVDPPDVTQPRRRTSQRRMNGRETRHPSRTPRHAGEPSLLVAPRLFGVAEERRPCTGYCPQAHWPPPARLPTAITSSRRHCPHQAPTFPNAFSASRCGCRTVPAGCLTGHHRIVPRVQRQGQLGTELIKTWLTP
jgi:hypothetical protein